MTGSGSAAPAESASAVPVREIVVDSLDVDLGGTVVLADVTVRLDQRRIAVIGANGSGKSTFARVLGGLVTPTRGSVAVHGIDVARQQKALRRAVGIVFTNPDAQILMPTVAEDVAFSLRGSGLTRDEIADRVAAALDVYGLTALAEAPAHQLSGGQKQLLALAAVLVRRPALVIADEPTTLLDLGNARRVGGILIDALEAQLVVVTHDLEVAARCDVALRFAEGRLVDAGEPAALIADYRALHA
ncbi:ABC transporter ATP-binding protein [Schumannella luteola]|uniref:Biotin transport system ATP-binding protein n=1 Tax=Schumannella luteola TaxID=472059 RepID=A0A852YRU3_9MICO|nr:ABC transporter ATP-binding protein [Schumannella luteola]NYG99975.1 biotin transport system ATP-binding protein [Schumannella luteola]TPX05482.1 ABC transporter ATP-binding protein [Schumannella luteola]